MSEERPIRGDPPPRPPPPPSRPAASGSAMPPAAGKAPRSLQELLASRNAANPAVVAAAPPQASSAPTPPSASPPLSRISSSPPLPALGHSTSAFHSLDHDDLSSLANPTGNVAPADELYHFGRPLESASSFDHPPSPHNPDPQAFSAFNPPEGHRSLRSLAQDMEEEMPCQSTILSEEVDLMALLHSDAFQPSNQQALPQTNSALSNDDVIDLYSTIAMLKRENNELSKEIKFVSMSKDAIIADLTSKLEVVQTGHQQAPALKKELAVANETIMVMDKDIRHMDDHIHQLERQVQELQGALTDKDEVVASLTSAKSSDANALRSDYNALKMEMNKIKMESSVLQSNVDKLKRENDHLKGELDYLGGEQDKHNAAHSREVSDLQMDRRKADDQVQVLRGELQDKIALVNKLTTDLSLLESNYNSLNMELSTSKQRVFALEMVEREYASAKYHIGHLESSCSAAQMEVAALKQQIQALQMQYQQAMSVTGGMGAMSAHSVPSMPIMPQVPAYKPQPYSANYASDPSPHAMPAKSSLQPAPVTSGTHGHGMGISGGGGRTSKSLSSALGDHSDPYAQKGSHYAGGTAATGGAAGAGATSLASAVGRTSVGGGGGGSLASLLNNHGTASPSHGGSGPGAKLAPRNSPFATEQTSVNIMSQYDSLERDLTSMMTEKTHLQDEAEKLNVRGLKNLRDRTRLQQVEARLNELSKDISSLRQRLSGKPG